jgi:hypothetical protein
MIAADYLDIREFQFTRTLQPSLTGFPPQHFVKPLNQAFPDMSIGRQRPML